MRRFEPIMQLCAVPNHTEHLWLPLGTTRILHSTPILTLSQPSQKTVVMPKNYTNIKRRIGDVCQKLSNADK